VEILPVSQRLAAISPQRQRIICVPAYLLSAEIISEQSVKFWQWT